MVKIKQTPIFSWDSNQLNFLKYLVEDVKLLGAILKSHVFRYLNSALPQKHTLTMMVTIFLLISPLLFTSRPGLFLHLCGMSSLVGTRPSNDTTN